MLELRKRWPRRPLRSVASRQRSRNFGGMPRLAAEIPDIFRHGCRRAGKFRNDDGLGVVAVCSQGGCRREVLTTGEPVKESPSDIGATSKEKNNIVIPEFSAWLTLVLEQCRAENIRNLPRQRAPTPLFPERRPREACSMPISGCHDLPLATFNLPSRGQSPRRMSGTTVGRILSHPREWSDTHAATE